MQNNKQKFYLGEISIDRKQVSVFTVAPTKKRAAEIINCSVNFINVNFKVMDIDYIIDNERFKIACNYPEKLFIRSNEDTNNNDYRLFLDKERFISSSTLITDVKKKELYIKCAYRNKTKFLKVRLKDTIALANNMLHDIYFDISKLEVKQFFYIPFSEKLIDERWTHRAIETNQELDFILENMIDIYDEVVIPYSANDALDYIKIG